MWSRPASRGSAPRSISSAVRRLSTIGGVLLAATAATAGPASAAPSDITVPLSPAKPLVHAVVKPTPDASTRGDVTIGYGGSLTVQFPAEATPGPGTVFQLDFYEPSNPSQEALPGQRWRYSTDTSVASDAPLTVTELGGNAYRIEIPPVGMVDGLNNDHVANLQIDGLTTSVPGGVTGYGGGLDARVYVSTSASPSASLDSFLDVTSELPTVAVATGGTIRLKLPPASPLRTAGMTSLRDTAISLHRANAGTLNEDWGPAEPVTTSVASDGQSASLRIPSGARSGVYALLVELDARPDVYVGTDFLVELSAPTPVAPASTAPASTPAAAPVTTPARVPTSAQPAPDGVAAGATPTPDLRDASSRSAWVAWTGLGVAVVALAAGAGFLVRRRITHR